MKVSEDDKEVVATQDNQPNLFFDFNKQSKSVKKAIEGVTFRAKVLDILKDDIPRKGKEIHAMFGDMPYNSFSAQLSNLVKKGSVKKQTIENASNADKYFYHL